MYELYLNRLIDDEERSKEFLQELHDNNQMVKFLWEDSSYPFKDKLTEAAKIEYERNEIGDIYTSVARKKRNWERPWETIFHSENEFKLLLGIHGYWKKWAMESAKEIFLWFLLFGTVLIFVFSAIIGGMTLIAPETNHMFFDVTIGIFNFLEPYLIVSALFQFLHPAFDGTKATVYSVVLTSTYSLIGDKINTDIALLIVIIAFAIIYTIHTEREKKRVTEYRPYIGYYIGQ